MMSRIPAEISEDSFAAIGKVVVNAAALEHMLAAVAAVMTRIVDGSEGRAWEETHAKIWKDIIGKGSAEPRKVCIRLLSRIPTGRLTPERSQFISDLLDDTQELLERRHGIAHGMWEEVDGALIAWRPTRHTRDSQGVGEERIERVGGSHEELDILIGQIEEAVGDMAEVFRELWPEEWNPLPKIKLKESDNDSTRRPRSAEASADKQHALK